MPKAAPTSPTDRIFDFPEPFCVKTTQEIVEITLINTENLDKWLKKQDKNTQNQVNQSKFTAKKAENLLIRNKNGEIEAVLCGISIPTHHLDGANAYNFISSSFSDEFLNNHTFAFSTATADADQTIGSIGWGLGAYKFDHYIESKRVQPKLLWSDATNQDEALATIRSICLIRNLINTPANTLGTDELAAAAQKVAKNFKAKVKITKNEEELKKNFPMIHTVGKASPRPPQLVDMNWGSKKDPKVTIVGKGIIYDTGGLNLKPGMYMRDMKKDMGGSAHALGLAWMIMALELPVQLRVLIPIAENSVAGNSYRPGDIIESRKGLSVEIGDTDAEGRLVVADALTYASEDEPDLLVDFCTLTGAARVALGYDIPAFFTNKNEMIEPLRKSSLTNQDPIWPLPLWDDYNKEISSPIADITNDGSGRAGAIYGALFLHRFLQNEPDWVHLDCFAWEQNGKVGQPKGGSDTGMRAIFEYIKERYSA